MYLKIKHFIKKVEDYSGNVLYEYKDNNRLHVYTNISDGCYSIFNSQNQEVLFAFRYLKDINILHLKNNPLNETSI